MGAGKSKAYVDEISDSESDSEEYFDYGEPSEPQTSMDNVGTSESAGPSYENCSQEGPAVRTDNTVDALVRNSTMPIAEMVLSVENVRELEKQLDEYEIASLIFLLCDPKYASETVKDLEQYQQNRRKLIKEFNWPFKDYRPLLTEWAVREDMKETKWQLKLVEALCIIQNYKILRELGYTNKTDLIGRFCPQNGLLSECIDKTRKTLYLIAEKLDDQETELFLKHMFKEFFYYNMIPHPYDTDILEVYFLDWLSGYSNSELIMQMVKKVLKLMDLEVLGDSLVVPELPYNAVPCDVPFTEELGKEQTWVPTENVGPRDENVNSPKDDPVNAYTAPMTLTNENILLRQPNQRFIDTVHGYEGGQFYEASANASVSLVRRNSEHCYDINEDRPGKVLLIDQKYFHTEVDERYKDLLHPRNSTYQLETRVGTEKDRKRLMSVFGEKLKFDVQLEKNLPHYELIEVIERFVESIRDESSLFICILSHGEKGVVYGSNSCKVPIEKIEKIMVSRNKGNLQGKPKVLILQSCQGTYCQKLEDDHVSDDEDAELYRRDGASDPRSADLLKFYSTIPGYASVRNMERGTWFIQALCNAIEEYYQTEHFLDICTRVNSMVSTKKWKEENKGTNIMMPMLVHTFRKQFYFPRR